MATKTRVIVTKSYLSYTIAKRGLVMRECEILYEYTEVTSIPLRRGTVGFRPVTTIYFRDRVRRVHAR